jgi:phytanoyl-CoA hydroxylase
MDLGAQVLADGYAVVERLLSSGEVEACRDEISAIIAGTAENASRIMVQIEPAVQRQGVETASRELSVRKLMSYVPHSRVLTAVAEHPRIRELLAEVLGSDVKLLQDMALLKPPWIGSRKVWHQDCPYFPIEPPDVVGFWIALDHATAENGCMQVYPRTHRQALPHERVEGEDFADFGIPPGHPLLSEGAPTAVPLASGDALLFHGMLVHGTEPNRSRQRRRALQLHYMSARCRYVGRNETPAFRQILGRSYEGCV